MISGLSADYSPQRISNRQRNKDQRLSCALCWWWYAHLTGHTLCLLLKCVQFCLFGQYRQERLPKGICVLWGTRLNTKIYSDENEFQGCVGTLCKSFESYLWVSDTEIRAQMLKNYSDTPKNFDEISSAMEQTNLINEPFVVWTDFERINMTHFRNIGANESATLKDWLC